MNDVVEVADEPIVEIGADVTADVVEEVVKPDGDTADKDTKQDEVASPAADESDVDETEDDDVLRKRIGKLAFENRQLKRDLDARPAVDDQGKVEPEEIKTQADFKTEQEFNDYLIDKGAERADIRAEQREHASAATRQQDEFKSREEAYSVDKPDYDKVVHSDDLEVTPFMAQFLQDPESEIGLDVAYYLGKHPAEAGKIAAMDIAGQGRAMVKLETKIAKEVAKVKAEKSKTSKAPAPPSKTIDGEDAGTLQPSAESAASDKLSDERWLAQRRKHLAK